MVDFVVSRPGAAAPAGGRLRKVWASFRLSSLLFSLLAATVSQGADAEQYALEGLSYTNCKVAEVPWSIHVASYSLTNQHYFLLSVHARGGALGLSTVSDQVASLRQAVGTPVAAVNGDFYQRDRTYAGHPRGLQVADGELLSAPNGGISFWIDAAGQPHATNVQSRFQAIWPDGTVTPIGLNEPRRQDRAVLYTPAIGRSTLTPDGREFVLERTTNGRWLPLRIGSTYSTRIRSVREAGNTPLSPGTLVLSLGPVLAARLPKLEPGAEVGISTETAPALRGIRTAIGGGPMLVRDGRPAKMPRSAAESYEFSSMFERHPRAAVGWNDYAFFLVEVDGRQRGLSVGMTLNELSKYLVGLGCNEAMNLDGGGSATLWFLGEVRNNPCDGYERPMANTLVVVRKQGNPDQTK